MRAEVGAPDRDGAGEVAARLAARGLVLGRLAIGATLCLLPLRGGQRQLLLDLGVTGETPVEVVPQLVPSVSRLQARLSEREESEQDPELHNRSVMVRD